MTKKSALTLTLTLLRIGWRLETTLEPNNGYNGSDIAFGTSVGIFDDVIVVGAQEFGVEKCCYGTVYLFAVDGE